MISCDISIIFVQSVVEFSLFYFLEDKLIKGLIWRSYPIIFLVIDRDVDAASIVSKDRLGQVILKEIEFPFVQNIGIFVI